MVPDKTSLATWLDFTLLHYLVLSYSALPHSARGAIAFDALRASSASVQWKEYSASVLARPGVLLPDRAHPFILASSAGVVLDYRYVLFVEPHCECFTCLRQPAHGLAKDEICRWIRAELREAN